MVLVNPHAADWGTARSIQEGIDMVAPGGRVLVIPGTYDEALVIDKGLTLEAVGDGNEPVIVSTPATAESGVEVTTSDRVIIRGVTLRHRSANGIRGLGLVDMTVERTAVSATDPRLGVSGLITADNDPTSRGRSRLLVRQSVLDGGLSVMPPPYPQNFGIRVLGNVDALIEENMIRRTGGACIQIAVDPNGETNADVIGNNLDDCYPLQRAAAILVSPVGVASPPVPVTWSGVVNIVENTIRNSTASCMPSTGITYEILSGRIERNRILGVVKPCAVSTVRSRPAGILIGSVRGFPPSTPVLRFNDIVGNAHAGVRISSSQPTSIDATCNWWGSPDGPSGVGPGSGDALEVDAGAAVPAFAPFATAPIAQAADERCAGH